MSRDLGMGQTCDLQVRSTCLPVLVASGGLVVLAWVDDRVAQDLAGGCVDDGHVEVLDEQGDVGSGRSLRQRLERRVALDPIASQQPAAPAL